MSSRRARFGAVALAAVFVLMSAANAYAQQGGATITTQPTTTTTTTTTIGTPTTISTTTSTTTMEPATTTTVYTAATMDAAQVTVPPQERGPLTLGRFNAAVNAQATHLARLRRLTNLSAQNITVIPVSRLNPAPGSTMGTENAINRASTRATSARNAARNNATISSALSAAGVNADNVLAISVTGHNLNDVTIYHR